MDKLGSAVADFVPRAQQHPILAVIATLAVISIATRLWTASTAQAQSQSQEGPSPGAKPVPNVPFWLPGIGHVLNMALDSGGFLSGLREVYTDGIFALNFFGSKHIFISRPELGTTLLNKPASVADGHALSKSLMMSNFCWPAGADAAYEGMLHDLLHEYRKLSTEPYLGRMISRTVSALRANLPDLVTFNDSSVDQSPWERTAGAFPTEDRAGQPVVETSLWDLVRNFVSATANPALIGTDFLTNFPDYCDYLWVFDDAFLPLAMGLPSWLPWPALRRGRAAQKHLMACLREFETALDKQAAGDDPGVMWGSLDDVSDLIKGRIIMYRHHGLSIEQRAACENGLMWAMNANANPAVAWVLAHVFADADLLAQMREEVAPFISIPSPDGPLDTRATFDAIDVEGLVNSCPLLKAAYIESLRLEVHAWSIKVVHQDVITGERDKTVGAYKIPAGTYAHVAHELHHTDPKRFADPNKWNVQRHIRWEQQPGSDGKVAVADMGTVRPYGGGVSQCKGRAFALKEILIFTAAIITFYDMEPAGGGPWKLPPYGRAAGTKKAVGGLKVWIKRRETA